MKRVDSDALGTINKALGLTGAGSALTELHDGVLDQVFEVSASVRRGRTQAATDGVYTAIMQTVHGAADSQVTDQRPYDLIAGGIAPYPNPMPPQFDIWLLGAELNRVSGTGTVEATLAMRYGTPKMGWAIDEAQAAVTPSNPEFVIAFWDALAVEGTTFGILHGSNGPYARFGYRLPRDVGSDLVFRSTASAIATYNCNIVLGVFPVGLGQDALV